MDIQKFLKQTLPKIEKPSRYTGGEYNTPLIKINADCRFAMCFPDIYEVGMSNLGIKLLYHILNNMDGVSCERCFSPWFDMKQQLKDAKIPLFSLETKTPLKQFDFVGFSMQYELSFTNVLSMLDLSQIALSANERTESDPIIVAGGPNCANPYPFSQFFDMILVGDGEDMIQNIATQFLISKRQGDTRYQYLQKMNKMYDCIYVPCVDPNKRVKRNIFLDLDKAYFPTKLLVPNIEAVFNRAMLEVFRGCTRGCRFCQAGYVYRPVRERSVNTLTKYANEIIDNCGYDEITLASLSTCDYSQLRQLLCNLKSLIDNKKIKIALPSTRVDSFEADFVDSSRKSSLTFAPEAGTQRLRDVINKNITEEEILNSLKKAFEKGYSAVKLYFMLGLPTETDEDVEAIFLLAKKIKSLYRQVSTGKKPLNLGISTSIFVPKPFTPFENCEFVDKETVEKRQLTLKSSLRGIGIKFSYCDWNMSSLECILGRGDCHLSRVVLEAYKLGACFDGWTEHFRYDLWLQAFEVCGVDMQNYLKQMQQGSWHGIDIGISKEFLQKDYQQALQGKTVDDCRQGCKNCGLIDTCRQI